MPTASSSSFQLEPDLAPVPSCRPWKHLENPAAEEWIRGPKEIHNYPNRGDFVILSINPVATVAHLNAAARKAARRIPRRKYVALAVQTHGLPIPNKPTHPYDFLFVRKGRPQPRLPNVDTVDSCFAILPNDASIPNRPTVCPAQPLPWDDCYLDTTYGFPYPCRVTSISRDYTSVLPMLDREIIRIRNILQKHRFGLTNIRMEQGDKWPQPFDFVELPPLPVATTEVDEGAESNASGQPARNESDPVPSNHPDDISIIGSDDGSQSEHHDADAPEAGDEEGLEMFLAFESMMSDVGDLRDPVVDVWYDLDMVTEIVDPVHFLEDVKRLTMIMDEAEMRLGRHPDPMVPDYVSDSDPEQSSLREGHDGRRSIEHSLDGETDSASTGPQPETRTESSRARLGSTTSKLFLRARILLLKIGLVRSGKSANSRSQGFKSGV
ncbi:unnamed protein product [Peniophora sp. CBMAI 1063]|nr:unnamed protein product [Peniophora sp. CBMAI 1063]